MRLFKILIISQVSDAEALELAYLTNIRIDGCVHVFLNFRVFVHRVVDVRADAVRTRLKIAPAALLRVIRKEIQRGLF